jgi:hypothetical protein
VSIGLRAHVLAAFTLVTGKVSRAPSLAESAITGTLNIIASTVPFGGLLQLGSLVAGEAFNRYELQIYQKITQCFALENIDNTCMDIALNITLFCQEQGIFARSELKGKTEGELGSDALLFLLDYLARDPIMGQDPTLAIPRAFEQAFAPRTHMPQVISPLSSPRRLIAPDLMQWIHASIQWLNQAPRTIYHRQEFLMALRDPNLPNAIVMGDAELYRLFYDIHQQGDDLTQAFIQQLEYAIKEEHEHITSFSTPILYAAQNQGQSYSIPTVNFVSTPKDLPTESCCLVM